METHGSVIGRGISGYAVEVSGLIILSAAVFLLSLSLSGVGPGLSLAYIGLGLVFAWLVVIGARRFVEGRHGGGLVVEAKDHCPRCGYSLPAQTLCHCFTRWNGSGRFDGF